MQYRKDDDGDQVTAESGITESRVNAESSALRNDCEYALELPAEEQTYVCLGKPGQQPLLPGYALRLVIESAWRQNK